MKEKGKKIGDVFSSVRSNEFTNTIWVRLKNISDEAKDFFLFDYLTDMNNKMGIDTSDFEIKTSYCTDFDLSISNTTTRRLLSDCFSDLDIAKMLFKSVAINPVRISKIRFQTDNIKQMEEKVSFMTYNPNGHGATIPFKPIEFKQEGQLFDSIMDMHIEDDKSQGKSKFFLDSTLLVKTSILPKTSLTITFFESKV
jgi:hypothetical protein